MIDYIYLEKYCKNLKVLYVEDDKYSAKKVKELLDEIFPNVVLAKNGDEALKLFLDYKRDTDCFYDLVITDIKMPKLNGLDMIRQIRKEDKKTQFIVLTAFTDKEYLLDAIDLGLVKYLSKPIRHETIFPLLLQCAKNCFEADSNKKYFNEKSYFNLFESKLVIDEEEIKLTKSEIKLLELLCKKYPNIASYDELQDYIWFDEYMSENAVRLLVRDLRKKLPKNSIKNISKLGYKIEIL